MRALALASFAVLLGACHKSTPASSAKIDAVTGDVQARQGGGGTLTVTGTGLAGVSAATIGDLAAVVSGVTDTGLKLTFAVPHAHALGALPLALVTPDGSVMRASAVTITAITVATTGSDSAAGTTAAPLLTIGAALQAGESGDTIALAGGTFSNEVFPLAISGVTLDGGGATISGPTTTDGLHVSGTTTIENVTINGFAAGATVTGGTVTFDMVTIEQATDGGIIATGAGTMVTFQGGDLKTNGASGAGDGADARAGASLTLSGTHIAGNQGCGASVADGATLAITGAIIDSNVTCGLLVVENPAAVSASNDSFSNEPVHVIDARPERTAADGPVIELTGSTVGDTAFVAGTKALGPISNPPYWEIINPNNRLAFEPATWP